MADGNKRTSVLGIYSDRAGVERGADVLIQVGFPPASISILLPESLGGAPGLLVAIGTLAIPGLGPFIAAGPLMSTLAGLEVGGAVGGVAGALIGLGIPEYEAKLYERSVKKGGILVSVHCDTSEDIGSAKDLLKGSGATDISSSGEPAADATVIERRVARSSKAPKAVCSRRCDSPSGLFADTESLGFFDFATRQELPVRSWSSRARGPGWHLGRAPRD